MNEPQKPAPLFIKILTIFMAGMLSGALCYCFTAKITESVAVGILVASIFGVLIKIADRKRDNDEEE